MKNSTSWLWLLNLATASFLTLIVACGGGNNNNNPNPAPAASNPAPISPVGPMIPGSNCPILGGGVPLNSNGSPFFGSMKSNSSGAWGNTNTLTLNLSFANYSGPGTLIQNLIGSGSFVFPDLSYLLGTQTNNINLCVSSNNVGAAGYNPGTFNMGNGTLSLTLNGTVPVPLYNPFNYYPGSYPPSPSNQMGQEVIRLNIGMSCAAYVNNNRIFGCVDVRVGNSPYGRVMQYYSR